MPLFSTEKITKFLFSHSKKTQHNTPHHQSKQSPKKINISDVQIDKSKPLGEGGYGIVYKGTYRGTSVAIKNVFDHPDSTDSFNSDQIILMTELQKLKAPHIIQLYAYTSIHLPYYLIMPLMENGSLYSHISNEEHQPFDMSLRYTILISVAKALAFMHHLLTIHCDIKPDNVLLDKHFKPYLSDFDSAQKLISDKPGENSITAHIGTRLYLAPEILTSSIYTKSSDVYAFTILLWETLAWKEAYLNVPVKKVKQLVRAGDRMEIPAEFPKKIKRLITFGWHQNPDNRPSIDEVQATLERQVNKLNKHSNTTHSSRQALPAPHPK